MPFILACFVKANIPKVTYCTILFSNNALKLVEVVFCIEESVIKGRHYFSISVNKYVYPFED